MLVSLLQVALLGASLVLGAPARLEERDDLPTVTFPDATYRAVDYNKDEDIYTFKNIRFAAPPTGQNRWAKPAPAPKNSAIQDGSYGNACPQAPVNGLNIVGSNTDPLTALFDQFITNKILAPVAESGGAEDCLFLDIYVPGSAIRGEDKNLPVVHWIYGGAYILGHKNQLQDVGLPFYDGSGLVTQSGNKVIFVGSNYRLGAFGFLAGKTMEAQGLPNAGLWDQRAAGEWIQKNIGLVGGNPKDITVFGESAGGGSILHHLTAAGGTIAPWFSKVIVQSPAYQPMWDRKGTVEAVFQEFLGLAGCEGKDLACLRSAKESDLLNANTKLNQAATEGSFKVGPTADGSYVRQAAPLEFASGNYVKSVKSIMVSHVAHEATIFVDGNIGDDNAFNKFVAGIFPNYTVASGLNKQVTDFYPGVDADDSPYDTESDRVNAFVRDSSFTCNSRRLLDTYAPSIPSYAMQYSVIPGWHATDLLPTFWSSKLASSEFGSALAKLFPPVTAFSNRYKSYFTSMIRAGDPNTYRDMTWDLPWTIEWPKVGGAGKDNKDEKFSNVLNASVIGFSLTDDGEDMRTPCDFWTNVLAAATIQGGYSPPGAVVPSNLQKDTSKASSNYAIGK